VKHEAYRAQISNKKAMLGAASVEAASVKHDVVPYPQPTEIQIFQPSELQVPTK